MNPKKKYESSKNIKTISNLLENHEFLLENKQKTKNVSRKDIFFRFKAQADSEISLPKVKNQKKSSFNEKTTANSEEIFENNDYYLFGNNHSWNSNMGKISIYNKDRNTKKTFKNKEGQDKTNVDSHIKKSIDFLLQSTRVNNARLSRRGIDFKHINTRVINNNFEYIIEINNCDRFIFEIIKEEGLYKDDKLDELKKCLMTLEDIEVDFFLSLTKHCSLINLNIVTVCEEDITLNIEESKIQSTFQAMLIQIYILKNIVIIRNNENKLINSNLIRKLLNENNKFYLSKIKKNQTNFDVISNKESSMFDHKTFSSDSSQSNLTSKSYSLSSSINKKISKPLKKVSTVDVFELFKRLILLSIINIKAMADIIAEERNELETIYLDDAKFQMKRKNCYKRIFKLEETIDSLMQEIRNKYSMLNSLFNKNVFVTIFKNISYLSNIKRNQIGIEITRLRSDIEQLISFLLEADVKVNSHFTSIFSIKRNFKIILDDIHRVEDTNSSQIMLFTLIITSLPVPLKYIAGLLGMNINNPFKGYENLIPFFGLIFVFGIIMFIQYKAIIRYTTK